MCTVRTRWPGRKPYFRVDVDVAEFLADLLQMSIEADVDFFVSPSLRYLVFGVSKTEQNL